MTEWAMKRFWQAASTRDTGQGFAIELDGRSVKTPAKRPLVVPTLDLAQAIAHEWEAQEEKVDPLTMPFTRAANAALDKVTQQQAEVASLIADYGASDLLCYRAGQPADLVRRQAHAWDPILDWAQDTLGVRMILAEGVMHVDQPDDSIHRLRAAVAGQGPFSLTALHDLVSLSGSLLIGLAAQRGAFDISVLWAASIVDESFQMDQWGPDADALTLQQNKAEAFANAAFLQSLLHTKEYTA
ncbi:MAG: ATP12 family protein [Pseudomonadota bacterium]